jgi:F0F1-type ATP synthase membrane subunit a
MIILFFRSNHSQLEIMVKIALYIIFWIAALWGIFANTITNGFNDDTLDSDKYYELNAPNLNTMNSYIIPKWEPSDLTNYSTHIYTRNEIPLHMVSTYPWVIILIALLLLLGYYTRRKPNSRVTVLFFSLYQWVWEFFEDLLWENCEIRITRFVTNLFLVIFLSNLIWIFNDIIRFVIPQWLRLVTSPTAEFEFNLALALIAVGVTLYVQWKNLGLLWALHEYFPIKGKWLIEWGGIWAKIGDIIISMFIWFLDIIGTISKIVSLSMRLFWNMSSGSILLNVSIIWFTIIWIKLFGFAIPIWLPIITYIQSLLVAFVQAFVFTLIVVIGIKSVNAD